MHTDRIIGAVLQTVERGEIVYAVAVAEHPRVKSMLTMRVVVNYDADALSMGEVVNVVRDGSQWWAIIGRETMRVRFFTQSGVAEVLREIPEARDIWEFRCSTCKRYLTIHQAHTHHGHIHCIAHLPARYSRANSEGE